MIINKLEISEWQELARIDKENYNQLPEANWQDIALNYPNLYTLFKQENKICGYHLTLPLNEYSYNKLKNAEILESNLTSKDVSLKDPYGIYLASIGLDPDARKKNPLIGSTLMNNLINKLIDYDKNFLVMPITDYGRKLVKIFHLNEIKNKLDIPLFEGNKNNLIHFS
ncbi:MAG: hypothetical protein ACP5OG_04585 [Candidatus Nanoarchaeia archaeon]